MNESTCEKDIVVHIDNYLNFDVQRKEKIKKANTYEGSYKKKVPGL